MRIPKIGLSRKTVNPYLLLSLGLGAATLSAVSASAQANPNSSLFWRDLEAYSRAQRARYYQNETTHTQDPDEAALEATCLYARACHLEAHPAGHVVGEDYHSYEEISAPDGYMYSGYSLPRRLSYVRFEEAYSYSSPYRLRSDAYQMEVNSY